MSYSPRPDPNDLTYVPGDLNSLNLSYGSSDFSYRPGSLTSLSSAASTTSLDSYLSDTTERHRTLEQSPAVPDFVEDFRFNDDLTPTHPPRATPNIVGDFNNIRGGDLSTVEGVRRPPLNLANFNLEQNRIIKEQFEEWQRANPRPGVSLTVQRQQFADAATGPNTSSELSGSIQNWLHESLHNTTPNSSGITLSQPGSFQSLPGNSPQQAPFSDTLLSATSDISLRGPSTRDTSVRLSPPPSFQSLLRGVPEQQTPYDSINDTAPIVNTPRGTRDTPIDISSDQSSIEVRADIRDNSPVSEEEILPRQPFVRGRGAPRYGTSDASIDISPIEPIVDGTINGTPGYGTPSTPSSYLGRRGSKRKRVTFSPRDSYAMQSDLSPEDVAVASTSVVNNSRAHRFFGRNNDRGSSYSSSEEFRDSRPPPNKRGRPRRMTTPTPRGAGFQPDALPPSAVRRKRSSDLPSSAAKRKRPNALPPSARKRPRAPGSAPLPKRRNARPFTPITPFRTRPFQPNGPSARRNAIRRLNSTPNPVTPGPAGPNPLTPNVSSIAGSANAQPPVSGVGNRTVNTQPSGSVPTGGASNADMGMLLMMSMMQQGSNKGGGGGGPGGGGPSRGGYGRGRGYGYGGYGYGGYGRYGPGSRGGVIRGSGSSSERSNKEGVPTNNSGKSIMQILEDKKSNLSEYLEMIGPSSEFIKSLNYGYNNKSDSAIKLLAEQHQQH